MSFCQNCGTETAPDAKFCSNCGNLINNSKNIVKEVPVNNEDISLSENELSAPIRGTVKSFPLCNKILEVSEDIDTYNSYRMIFRSVAKKCSDSAVKEYLEKIHNLDDFLMHFETIYFSNMKMVIQKSIDVLVLEEIYSITYDDFQKMHMASFNSTLGLLDTVLEKCRQAEEINSKITSGVMSGVQSIASDMLRKKGVNSNLFNSLFDGIVEGVTESAITQASKMSDDQKIELYNRISPHLLFNAIFYDYWNVYHTLIHILNQKGHTIYWPNNEMLSNTGNIFENLSNPNFKQDKLIDAFLGILRVFPYNEKYYEFMREKFGETDEVKAIIEYFGYDFEKIIYSESDYPKIELQKPVKVQSNDTDTNITNDVLKKLNIDKGAMKDALKSASESPIGKSIFGRFKK